MKCKIFYADEPALTVDSFNRWAKGKALTKQVIIHSIATRRGLDRTPQLIILVYHPEDPEWDKTVE